MKLIITEKNQTAKRIAEILSGGKAKKEGGPRSTIYVFQDNGESVTCIGMRGHILKVDFPDEYRQWQQVDPKDLLKAEILKIPTEKALINRLKKLAKEADSAVIATDFDREGELIGFDVMAVVREANPDIEMSRARFSALTEPLIKQAFSDLDTLDEDLAHAGEARQDIDLMWGASLTRFISLATTRLGSRFLSVGRVQSPTLALIVEKEKEVKAFVPEDFWQIKVDLDKEGFTFKADHKQDRFKDEPSAKAVFEKIGDTATVVSVQKKDRKIKPPAPFNTTSFLAAASSIRVPPVRAMDIAERLYMRGLTSYPRVDNTVYPESLDLHEVLAAIEGSDVVGPLASDLKQQKKFTPTRGKKFSSDHPPIYPTGAAHKSDLSDQEWKIYELISRRFMATLATEAKAQSTRADFDINGEPFTARGDVITDEGFMKYYHYSKKKDDLLPELIEDEKLRVVDSELLKKQTQPPPRYSEGKLIEKMEDLGLGTKSTRHSIIQNLVERGYVLGSPLRPSETGIAVSETLNRHAEMVTTPDMTAQLEGEMDNIAEGRKSLENVVDVSRNTLGEILDVMEKNKDEISHDIREGMKGDITLGECPVCDGEIRIKTARKSRKRFAGCNKYPDCEQAYPLPQRGMILPTGEVCEHCGSPAIKVINKGRKPWELCLDPECPTKTPKKKDEAKDGGSADSAGAEKRG